jgi:hypothetical protein
MAGLAVRGKREVELPGAVLQSSRSCHNSPVSHPTQSVFIHTHHQTYELASNCILKFDGSRCEVSDSLVDIAGYYTRLRHIDFCRRLASAMTIPLGLALVLHHFAFSIL